MSRFCNTIRIITLLAFTMQIGSALNANTQAKSLQPQPFSAIEEYDKNDPINSMSLDTHRYFHDFYNTTEWEEKEPVRAWGPEQYKELLGGDPSQNLCFKNHFIPELMIIGAAKASTTTLCSMLRGSPSMLWPLRFADRINSTEHPAKWKEGHYFDDYYTFGMGYMITDFPKCSTQYRFVAVDGSARYYLDQSIPDRISRWYGRMKPRLKFVFIIREPLARLHSHYWHSVEDDWCILHKKFNFSQTIDQLLAWDVNAAHYVSSEQNDPRFPKVNPIPGCTDFLEGSLYIKTFNRFFKHHFKPSQFTLVPFLFNVDPGNDGRSPQILAESIWSKFGFKGISQPIENMNDHPNPRLEEDLRPDQIQRMRKWFDILTGPAVIAEKVRGTEISLFGYQGDPDDAAAIAQWISSNW